MAAWNTVYAKLLAELPTITGLDANTVFDGPIVGEKTAPNLAIVGDNGAGSAGSYTTDYSDVGGMTDETGEIFIRFFARSGSVDAFSTLRTTVAAWTDALTVWLHADKTLGGALTQGSTVRVARVEPMPAQSSDGALVELVVTIDYMTRL